MYGCPLLASLIVPTRNSAATLAATLDAIRAQTHQPVELIVVDNDSTDATPGIARVRADVVLDAGPERSAQRNAGAVAARGELLGFIDSDMVLEPEVVAQAVARLGAGDGAVIVPETSFGTTFWARVKALERSCYVGDETIEAARLFSRTAWDAAGGYDEAIVAGPEDWDLHQRVRDAGFPVGRTAARIHHDEGALTLRETMATKYYYGRSTREYLRKHPVDARRQLTVARPAFLRHWRRLARRPGLGAAVIAMKVAELSAGAAGMAVSEVGAGRTRRP